MAKKLRKIDSGSIEIYPGEEMIRLDLYDDYFSGVLIAKFFVPASTKDKFGNIPEKIVRYRLKHDFNIEVGHYSTCIHPVIN